MQSGNSQGYEVADVPDLDVDPLNEVASGGLICKAFPVLFPYGGGDLHAPSLYTITKHKYFKYFMQYCDGRFANDPRFPYYAYNSVARWDAINCGNVYVRMNHMNISSFDDMREMLNNEDRDLAGAIMYYGTSLRGRRFFGSNVVLNSSKWSDN